MKRSACIIALMAFVLLIWGLSPSPNKLAVAQLPQRQGVPTLAPLVARVTPAVVNIAVTSRSSRQDNPLLRDPFFRYFFDFPRPPATQQRMSVGSGVIVDAKNGYVMTNHHVIENATEIVVTLRDRRKFTAQRIGSDAATDIALIRIKADKLAAVQLGDSDQLQVGDYVLAIGNPFGLGQTVTSGIVSALGRRGLNVEGYEDFIQTDASINPGNSGGALVNLRGELVGINTAIIGPTGGNIGIGFAVPSNIARVVMDQLLAYGEIRRGRLGIVIQDLTPELARSLGLELTDGVIVTAVEPNSSAARAGLRVGDVIVAFDGRPVHGAGSLRNQVGLTARGKSVTLTLYREKRRLDVRVTIGNQNTASAGIQAMKSSPLAGARLRDDKPVTPTSGERGSVLVDSVEPDSPAARHGLRAGDHIVVFNRYPVWSLKGLNRLLDETNGAIVLIIIRNGQRRLLILKQ